MSTNSTNTISKYLLLFLLILIGASCNDSGGAEGTSIPVLISQNINDSDIISPDGYVELTFSKTIRQAPDIEIYFNGRVMRISVNYEKIRYTFPGMENRECTFEVSAGVLTDIRERAYDEDSSLNLTAKSETSGGGKALDAIVDSKGNGDHTTLQATTNTITTPSTSLHRTFITNGIYNEYVRTNKNKPFAHLIGEGRDDVKTQFVVNHADDSSNATSWPYSIFNENSPARETGHNESQNAVMLTEATDSYTENISIINLYGAFSNRHTGGSGKNGQVEVLINREDHSVLNNCLLASYQDMWQTRYQNNTIPHRTYVYDSWIEGHTDYIWENGDVLIENSTFYNTGSNGSSATAASHISEGNKYEYVIGDYMVGGGGTKFSFGCSQATTTKTVWINTKLRMGIINSHWGYGGQAPALYAEYNAIDRNGSVITESKVITFGDVSFTNSALTASKVTKYTYESIITTDSWSPKEYTGTPLVAPTNIDLSGNTLTWDVVSGAAGYLISMNSSYTGQTADTTVTLANTDESSIYTVKTVSQYGTVNE